MTINGAAGTGKGQPWPPFEHDAESFHAIAVVVASWNAAEQFLERLVWRYLGLSDAEGPAITSRVQNVSLAEMLLSLTKIKEKDPKISEAIEHAVVCFNINRENRNLLVHGRINFMSRAATSQHTFTKVTANRAGVKKIEITLNSSQIKKVADNIIVLTYFFFQIESRIMFNGPYGSTIAEVIGGKGARILTPSLDKLPRPNKLESPAPPKPQP